MTRARAQGRENGLAAAAVLTYLGFSLQLLQVGIIPLLPSIGAKLHVSPATASWLVTGSLLSGVVCLALLCRLADLIGKRPVVLIALVLVLAGSVLGCVTDSFAGLLVARILMGAVLPMLALPEAIAADTMPRARAQVTIGAIHAGTGLGIAGGLLLGALAGSGHASWRTFFVVGVVASALAIVATVAVVRDSPARASGGLDVTGAVLLGGGLVAVLLALSQGPTWHWGSISTLGVGALGIVVLAAWWTQQRAARQPLIDVRRIMLPELRVPYAITFLASIGVYGALSAITRLAQTPPAKAGYGYGYSPVKVGWYALPQALGAVAGLVLIRAFVSRQAHARALSVGTALIVVAFLGFGLLTSTPGLTMASLLVDSAGLAVTLAVTQIVIVRAVTPAESGIALGLSIVLYAVGNSIGSAAVGALFAGFTLPGGLPSLAAYHWGFVLGGVTAALALALTLVLAVRSRESEAPGRQQRGGHAVTDA
jgi:predicted MFS family arabinose efflux permease